MKDAIQANGVCYALLQLKDRAHPIAKFQHDLIWYPERSLTLLDCVQYRPYVKSVVTENPWIIACYDRENVRIWDSETQEWRCPDYQTYGASESVIYSKILGIHQSLPSAPLDGGKQIRKYIKTLKYPEFL